MVPHAPEVDAWFAAYDNPQREHVMAVRDVVLSADERVTETVKWQAPTFVFHGNIASFYPRSKKAVSLMFHTGATLPDPEGILGGTGDTTRVARFRDADDLDAKAEAPRGLVRSRVAAHEPG